MSTAAHDSVGAVVTVALFAGAVRDGAATVAQTCTARTRSFSVSAMKRRPAASMATPEVSKAKFSFADFAGPLSPEKSVSKYATPLPATVVMICVCASILRRR